MYGIDLTPELLQAQSWRWLRARILGLLDRPPILAPYGNGWQMIASTRLGLALFPPRKPREE